MERVQDKLGKTPDDTDANKALRKALNGLTTGGHLEMLSVGSDKGISLKQLQDAFIVSAGIEGG